VVPGSFAELADRASRFAARWGRSGQWDIVTLDWGPFSHSTFSENARMSRDIMESLVTWLQERQFQYSQFHLLSHSSGSWGIDRMSEVLVQNGTPPASISLTFFDVYKAPFLSTVQLGEAAGYAEQYVDSALLPPWTDQAYPHMLNVDVTALPHTVGVTFPPGLDSHAWPYRWYITTIPLPLDPLPSCSTLGTYWGFARSPLAQSVLSQPCTPNPNLNVLGAQFILLPSGKRRIDPYAWDVPVVTSYQPSTTGSVSIDASGTIRLVTGSPAWVSVTYSVPFATKFVRFNYRFTSTSGSPTGAFTVALNGQVLADVTEQGAGSGIQDSGPIYLGGPIGPGHITFEFRLEPQSGPTSSVEVTDVEFGVPPCRPDFDSSDDLNVQDIFDFLDAWFAADPRADFNGVGGINVQDFFDFLDAWFAGCH